MPSFLAVSEEMSSYLPPQTERNCFRKLSNENLRETEGDFHFHDLFLSAFDFSQKACIILQ